MIIIDYNSDIETFEKQDIAERVVQWCLDNVLKRNDIDINMEICKYKTYKCWGTCVDDDGEDNGFHITIANDQSIRDFVATSIPTTRLSSESPL